MKKLIICLVNMLLLGFSAAVGAAEPIKVGLNLEMTGAVAAYAQQGYEGLQLIQELVKPEVLGRTITFVLLDNKSDRVESANAASRLIEREHVVAIIGPMTSGNMLAAGEVTEKHGIPTIGPSTTNPLVTQGKKYIFRACFVDTVQGEVAAKYAYKVLGARRAAIISDIAQDYCVALGNFFKKAFENLGGKVVTVQHIRTGDQDFTAQLTVIKQAKPDIIYMPNYYTEIALVTRQARDLGITQPILSADGADSPEVFAIGGDAVEGLMHTAMWHEKAAVTSIGKKYLDAYKKKFGTEPNAFGALTADAYLMLIDAIKRANSTDPEKIRKALEDIQDLDVVTGRVTIENGDAIKPVVIRVAKNGKWEFKDLINP